TYTIDAALLRECRKTGFLEADGKYPDARLPKSRGMRRTYKYAAVTRDEGNAVLRPCSGP
ncbi:MAG: hypothetical protein PVH99_10110, partial [Desulfobacteraceae bacterium]